MSTKDRVVRIGFVTCAVIGALILIGAITIEAIGVIREHSYELPHKVYLIGMLFGFVGFYGLDHRGAIEGTMFIVDIAGRVVPFLRAGRRKTDAIVAVDETAVKVESTTTTTVEPQGDTTGEKPKQGE